MRPFWGTSIFLNDTVSLTTLPLSLATLDVVKEIVTKPGADDRRKPKSTPQIFRSEELRTPSAQPGRTGDIAGGLVTVLPPGIAEFLNDIP